MASVESRCPQHGPGLLEGGHGSHHFNWGTSKAKLKRQRPSPKELRTLCQASEGRGCVIWRWPFVMSKLAHIPKGPGQEMAGVPFADQREPPSIFGPEILALRPFSSRHVCNHEGLLGPDPCKAAQAAGFQVPSGHGLPVPGDEKKGYGDPPPSCPSARPPGVSLTPPPVGEQPRGWLASLLGLWSGPCSGLQGPRAASSSPAAAELRRCRCKGQFGCWGVHQRRRPLPK